MKKPELIALLIGSALVWAAILLDIAQPWSGTMSLVGLSCIGFYIGWKFEEWKGGK